MAVDARLSSSAPAADHGGGVVTVPARTQRIRSWILLALAAWNVWVWTTRAVNMIGERNEWDVAFVVVHLLLFGGGLGGAVVLGVVGWRMRREARAARPSP